MEKEQIELMKNIAFYSSHSLLNILKLFQANPEVFSQAGLTGQDQGQFSQFTNELSQFIQTFSSNQQQNVS